MIQNPLEATTQPFADTKGDDHVQFPNLFSQYRLHYPTPGLQLNGESIDELNRALSNNSQIPQPQEVLKAPAPEQSQNPADLNGSSTFHERLAGEGSLLASIPLNIGNGIVASAQDAWEHMGRTSFETASGLALGAGFCLLSKNPSPVITAVTTWSGRAFLAVAGGDLVFRFGVPMYDVWLHPENLDSDKKLLGNNLGDAVFNYSLAVVGGVAGSSLGDKYLATRKLGTLLQGFKETNVSAESINRILTDPHSPQPLAAMVKAFARRNIVDSGATNASPQAEAAPFKGAMRMRSMADGSHVGSSVDGSVMILTKDGTALWFKNTPSFFGLRNKLDLAKVFHPSGDETDVLTGIYSPTAMMGQPTRSGGRGTGFIGKDPAGYFEEPSLRSEHPTYASINGSRFITGANGTLSAVESGGNRVTVDEKGRWKLSLFPDLPHSLDLPRGLPKANITSDQFNMNVIVDRMDSAKKGAEGGLSQIVLERAGDIGSAIFEHQVLIQSSKPKPDKGDDNGKDSDASKHSI